jgi:hypothetical protein
MPQVFLACRPLRARPAPHSSRSTLKTRGPTPTPTPQGANFGPDLMTRFGIKDTIARQAEHRGGLVCGLKCLANLLAAHGAAPSPPAHLHAPAPPPPPPSAPRGLAAAATAGGLGTASLTSKEPEALPFCALSYALVGIFSTCIMSIPAVQAAAIAIVG